jgi:uncharacterized iron-regulated protein
MPAWQTSLDRTHPLVGRVWSTRGGRFVDEPTLRASLHGYVLLGEKHDNPDHHLLQARLLGAMRASGRRPVVAFEMLDLAAEERARAAQQASPSEPDAIARAVRWEKSGWPDFSTYAPVFREALAIGRPLVATGLAPETMRAIVRDGTPTTPSPVPLDEAEKASLREELVASHCGHLPEAMIEGMSRAQRARDATMADAMTRALRAEKAEDAVLVAGSGHVRKDRGVPRDLAALDAGRPVTSITMVEVEGEKLEPAAYAVRWNTTELPFDYLWFTPRAKDDDPCEGFRRTSRTRP